MLEQVLQWSAQEWLSCSVVKCAAKRWTPLIAQHGCARKELSTPSCGVFSLADPYAGRANPWEDVRVCPAVGRMLPVCRGDQPRPSWRTLSSFFHKESTYLVILPPEFLHKWEKGNNGLVWILYQTCSDHMCKVQFAPFLTQWCLWELCCPASLTRNGLGMFAGASASLISPWFKVMQLRKLYFHLNAVLRMFILYLFSLWLYHLLLALSLSLLQMEHDFFPALQSHQQLELHWNLFLQVSFASALNPLMSASKRDFPLSFPCELLFYCTGLRLNSACLSHLGINAFHLYS